MLHALKLHRLQICYHARRRDRLTYREVISQNRRDKPHARMDEKVMLKERKKLEKEFS